MKEFITWAKSYDDKLHRQLKQIDRYTKYYLSSDEGGMLGNPRFFISSEERQIEHFTPIGHLYGYDIYKFILGRIMQLMISHGDYSDKTQIIIEL